MNNVFVRRVVFIGIALSTAGLLSSCLRGQPSEKPPIHVFLDMDDQPKYQAFEKNEFFEDNSAMRLPVQGTQSFQKTDLNAGANEKNPIAVDINVLHKGQERYDVYCSPCHGMVGDGKGIVAQRGAKYGYVAPSNFHDALIKDKTDAHYFDVITNGIRNMGPYGSRITQEERWAIVHYMRALQLSQGAPVENVPDKFISSAEGVAK